MNLGIRDGKEGVMITSTPRNNANEEKTLTQNTHSLIFIIILLFFFIS